MYCTTKHKSSPDEYELPLVPLRIHLTNVLRETFLITMLRHLQKEINIIGLIQILLSLLCIQLSASAYISANTVSGVQDSRSRAENRRTVLGKKKACGRLRKVVAKEDFYKFGKARPDSAMVEAFHDKNRKTELSLDEFLNF